MKISSLITKAKLGVAGLTALLAMAAAPHASALSLSLNPLTQTIGVGGTAVVQLNASNLGAQALGGFDIQIGYLQTIVGINLAGVTFGTGLNLGNVADSDTTGTTAGGGTVHLFEVSFVDPGVLAANQPNNFTLATLTFTGLSVGTTPLTISIIDLSDENGNTIASTSVPTTGAQIIVRASTSTVPEAVGFLPAALVLGLVLLVGTRYQKGMRHATVLG